MTITCTGDFTIGGDNYHKKDIFSKELEEHDGDIDFQRNGGANHIPGNISLSFHNLDGEMLLHRLDLKGICVSTGAACDSHRTQISHVLKAIGCPEEYAKGTIRISLGNNNTAADIPIIAEEIKRIIAMDNSMFS